MAETAGHRLRPIGLARGDIDGSLQPGKISPETGLLSWEGGFELRPVITNVGFNGIVTNSFGALRRIFPDFGL
jgi:hypothetical protein